MHRQHDDDGGFIEPKHGQPHRRAGLEIERALRFAETDGVLFGCALLGAEAAQVDAGDLGCEGGHDPLTRLAVVIDKAGAQDLVTLDQRLERIFDGGIGDGAAHLPTYGNVKAGIAGMELFEEPEALLRERARQGGTVSNHGYAVAGDESQFLLRDHRAVVRLRFAPAR